MNYKKFGTKTGLNIYNYLNSIDNRTIEIIKEENQSVQKLDGVYDLILLNN